MQSGNTGNPWKHLSNRQNAPNRPTNNSELTKNGPIQRLELRKRIIESQDLSWTHEREIPVSVATTMVRI
jgi:hypothetical protein